MYLGKVKRIVSVLLCLFKGHYLDEECPRRLDMGEMNESGRAGGREREREGIYMLIAQLRCTKGLQNFWC